MNTITRHDYDRKVAHNYAGTRDQLCSPEAHTEPVWWLDYTDAGTALVFGYICTCPVISGVRISHEDCEAHRDEFTRRVD